METHLADFIRHTPAGNEAEAILRKCVHCGFCTATCPTNLPTSATIYVICRSGNRSATATRALVAAGLDAYNVAGGMNAWTDAGLPVSHD